MKRTLCILAILAGVSASARGGVAGVSARGDDANSTSLLSLAMQIESRAAAMEKSVAEQVRQAAQETKAAAKDAEIAAKKNKMDQSLIDAGGWLVADSELLTKTAAAVSRGQGGALAQERTPKTSGEKNAAANLRAVLRHLRDFEAKLAGWREDNRRAGGGWLDPASLERLRRQLVLIEEEASRLRRSLEGRPSNPPGRSVSLSVGGKTVAFALEPGRLRLTAAGPAPAKTASLLVTEARVSRADLIRALQSLGLSQDAILKEMSLIEARLKGSFGLVLSTSTP